MYLDDYGAHSACCSWYQHSVWGFDATSLQNPKVSCASRHAQYSQASGVGCQCSGSAIRSMNCRVQLVTSNLWVPVDLSDAVSRLNAIELPSSIAPHNIPLLDVTSWVLCTFTHYQLVNYVMKKVLSSLALFTRDLTIWPTTKEPCGVFNGWGALAVAAWLPKQEQLSELRVLNLNDFIRSPVVCASKGPLKWIELWSTLPLLLVQAPALPPPVYNTPQSPLSVSQSI